MKRNYQVIFEAILSVLIIFDLFFLGLMAVGFTVGIMPTSIYSISNFDIVIAVLILIDFVFYRIRKNKSNDNRQFIRENWAYIISIIPITFICFNLFQLFGYISIIGLIGIFRIYALFNVLLITGRHVRKYPSKTKLDYATVVLLLVLIIGSYLLFIIEHGVNPGFSSFESAMWFSIVSMTTTGYGDITPVTFTGRIIAIILIFTGMGYLSLVTATLAYSFIDLFRKESRKAKEKLEE
ncbi:MAG: potassium channel family protein, partial [Methanobacterium sp.]